MRIKLFSFLLIAAMLMSGGCKGDDGIEELAKTEGIRTAVIQTKTQFKETKLDVYGEDGNLIGSNEYHVGGVGRYGFGNTQVRDGVLYEIAIGNDYQKDYGAVAGFDLNSGKMEEISFGHKYITDLCVTEKYIYVISNINGETSFDRYSFSEKKIDSFQWDKDAVMNFTVSDSEEVYFSDLDSGAIYSLEFEKGKVQKIGNIKTYFGDEISVSYMRAVGDKLYISLDASQIMIIDCPTEKIRLLDLELDSGGQIYDDGKHLYVASSDPVQKYDNGCIVKIDMETEKIVSRWDFDFNIYQYQVDGKFISILNWNDRELRQYSIKGNEIILEYQIPVIIGEDYHLSGMGFSSE